ncbi:MAG: XRE family transcriptional regulator [Sciscionella sp.]
MDIKTVERWVAYEHRRPHRGTRREVANLLSVDEVHLWPELAEDLHTRPNGQSEVVHVFPTRSAVPHGLWAELINGVTQQMDVLVFSGSFLVEQYNLLPVIRSKAAEGVRFRLAVGDENSSALIQRGAEEGTDGGLEGRAQLMRRYLQEVASLPGVEVCTHGTPLYNSIYRFDDQMLVNGHAYGSLAGQNPVMHLRELSGGLMWLNYQRSFERVWQQATPEPA